MRLASSFGALLLGFLATAPIAAAQASTAPGYRIAGSVVSRADGHPLTRARVEIVNVKDAKQVASTITSDDGKYEFTGLPAGKYTLTGAKRGYLPSAYDQHENFWTGIVTGAGLDTESLILRLWPAAYITGKVLDENGAPVREARVLLYHLLRSEGTSRVDQAGGTTTNDLGEYEFGPLLVAKYFVAVEAAPWYAVHPVTRQQDVGAPPPQVDPALDVAYPITYEGDATDSDSASPIDLHGGDRAQADIHLNPVPALHLFFQSGDRQNNSAPFPQFTQSSFGEPLPLQGVSPQPVAPGVWELTGVPAGRYNVQIWNSGEESELKQVDLANDGGELDLSGAVSSSTVKLQVSMADGTSLPEHLFVGLRLPTGKVSRAGQLDAKGEVTLPQVPQGSYEIFAGSSGRGYSVAQITSNDNGNDAEVSGRLLNVPAGANVSASVVLFTRTQNVQGFAKKNGQGFAGAMIILVPKDPATHPDLFRRDQSDLDGSFQVNGVVPGPYIALAIEDGWDLDWQQPGVLAPYMKGGQLIEVGGEHLLTLSQPIEVQAK